MRPARTLISLLVLLLACKGTGIEPGEVAATIKGAVVIDNWAKGCSGGGLEIEIGNDTYLASNAVPAAYEEPNSWPGLVWIRYQADAPDSCTQSTNRIKIISIRKRQ